MLTIRALVEDASLELRVLAEGAAGALDAPVLWVHNTELPDPSPYVRDRELVLTNGLWLDEASPEQFVERIACASGLVFGLRAEMPATPPALVRACADAGMALVEISTRVPFTAISMAAAALTARSRQDELVGMLRRGEALADAIAHGAGASGVLDVLRSEHDLPLVVVDRMGRQLATTGTELDTDERARAAAALAMRPPPLEIDLGGRLAAVYLVGAIGDVDAGLLCLRPIAQLDAGERSALEQSARFLSVEVAKRQAVQAIESRFAGEVIDMILSGPQRMNELEGRLRAFGIDPTGPLAVFAMGMRETPGGRTDHPGWAGVAVAVADAFLAEGIPAVVVGGSQDVVAVVPWRAPPETLAELGRRVLDAARRRVPDVRPVLGLGEPAPDSTTLQQSLVQARDACAVLRRRSTAPDIARFAELGTHRLILGLHSPAELRGFAAGVITPLRAHDESRGGKLERTLRTFFEHDGHLAATAAALFVHVNTLRNRLDKIAELTGRDPGRIEDLVDLYLALEADGMS
ncbi:helix-turn-helix domain-containing protein [Actinomycetes bacterium KLBMP 9759]